MTLPREVIAGLINGLAGLPYGSEVVDERTHALQTGWQAQQAGADDELLLAGDVARHRAGQAGASRSGRGCRMNAPAPSSPGATSVSGPRGSSPSTSPRSGTWSPSTRRTHAHLSPASVASLVRQGGPMSAEEVAEFGAHPNAEEAVMVRRWDDNAKDPSGPVLPRRRGPRRLRPAAGLAGPMGGRDFPAQPSFCSLGRLPTQVTLLPRNDRGRTRPKEVMRFLMRPYEIMVILDPTLDERTVAPSLETFLNVIRKDGGSVDKVDIWGRRRLAYEIAKHAEGIYAVIDVKAEPGHGVRTGPSARPERVRAADQGHADRQALVHNGCRRALAHRPNAGRPVTCLA